MRRVTAPVPWPIYPRPYAHRHALSIRVRVKGGIAGGEHADVFFAGTPRPVGVTRAVRSSAKDSLQKTHAALQQLPVRRASGLSLSWARFLAGAVVGDGFLEGFRLVAQNFFYHIPGAGLQGTFLQVRCPGGADKTQ